MSAVHPIEFHLHEAEAVLHIRWSDEHTSALSLRYLRGWCPCAGCQGHFTGYKSFIADANCALGDLQPVGGYAIRLVWGDGHQSGIYAYSYLLELEQGPPDIGPTNADCLAGRVTPSEQPH